MNRTVLTSFTILCLLSPVFLVGLALNIQTVKASGTIYIGADGSVDPPTAPIQRDGNIYTLIDNVNDEIIVQRDNIVVDGAGHTLHGTGSGTGIDLTGGSNVTIRNMEIKAFRIGIYFNNSSRNRILGNRIRENIQGIYVYGSNEPPETESWHNTIVGNDITENGGGILLEEAKFNSVSGNNITENHGNVDYPLRPGGIYIFLNSLGNVVSGNNIIDNEQSGIYFHYCTAFTPEWFNVVRGNNIINNSAGIRTYHGDGVDILENNIKNNNVGLDLKPGIVTAYHNNFINNTIQAEYPGINTIWDDGYPSGGNYWSDYPGVDLDHDGVGDSPYSIDADNEDNYPLMGMFSVFNATMEYYVNIISNSTISNLSFGVDYNELNNTISFNVTGANGTTGFCRITIPRGLMESPYAVLVNGEVTDATELPISNSTHAFLYFTYVHSTHTVIIFSWEDLLGRYIELLADYQSLNSTYYELLDEYDELLADCNSLNSTYHALLFSYMELLADYDSLQTNYTNLQSDYNSLNSSLNDLQEDYYTLNSLYNTLNATYNELKSEQEAAFSELYTIRDLMYVFIATTIILTVTTIYFATRKPKTRPKRKTKKKS